MTQIKHDSALVVLSGGQDSTTCLFWAKKFFGEVHAVTFDYGQTHAIEVESASSVARMAGCSSWELLKVGGILKSTSPLVNRDQKLEQYADWQALPGGLEKTFVPGRNALFFVLAANRAYALGCPNLVTGICQEDSGGYPDCREDFRVAMAHALRLANDTILEIHAPLMYMTKAESVRYARELPGCWEALAFTHTSYDGAYPPTGHDHATLLRAKGFEEACLPDPLVVRAVHEGFMAWPKSVNYLLISGVQHTLAKFIGDGMKQCAECGAVYRSTSIDLSTQKGV